MAFSNNMTKLLNKIENRLGLKILMPYLPNDLKKDSWAKDIIIPDTLTTFSRYYPNQIRYPIRRSTPSKDGWYYIDEDFLEGVEVLGCRDLDWTSFGTDNMSYIQNNGYGIVDYVSMQSSLSVEDVASVQMGKDINSLFNNGIYVEFKSPNMFKLTNCTNTNLSADWRKYDIILLIKHNDNLLTISPTMMETFEKLAISDVAGYLYRNLKYYNGIETVYATIDLKLEELEEKMNQRDSVIDEIKESYVSASNEAQPMVIVV